MNNETPKDNEFQVNQNNQQPVNPEVQEVPVTPATEEVPVIPTAPVTAEAYVAPKEPEAPKKRAKRKKGPVFYLIIVAIITVAAFFCSAYGRNLLAKLFTDSDGYFRYVTTNFAKDKVSSVKDFASETMEFAKKGVTVEMEAKLSLSDDAEKLINKIAVGGMNADYIDWFDSSALKFNFATKDLKAKLDGELKLNNVDIISVEAMAELSKNGNFSVFLTLPDYSKEALELKGHLPFDSIKKPSEIANDLLDIKLAEKIAKRYINVIADNFTKVSETTEEVSVGDVEEKLTVLETDIDEALLADITADVLKEVKKDKDFKEMFVNIMEFGGMSKSDAKEVYEDEFLEMVERNLDYYEDYEPYEEEYPVKLFLYVNNRGEIVGIKVKNAGFTAAEAEEYNIGVYSENRVNYNAINTGRAPSLKPTYKAAFEAIYVKEGGNVAFKVDILGNTILEGEGRESFGNLTSKIDILANDKKIIKLETKKLNLGKLNNGIFKGEINIAPGNDLYELLFGQNLYATMLKPFDLNLTIKSNSGDKNKIDHDIIFNSGSKELVKLELDGKISKDAKISAPKNTIDMNYSNEWAEDIYSKLPGDILNKLEKADMPSELIYMAKNLIYNLI